jgi:hypothetical protein
MNQQLDLIVCEGNVELNHFYQIILSLLYVYLRG